MAFSLVIIVRPEGDDTRRKTWETFSRHLQPEDLKGIEGVFSIGFNAWIFNTAIAMPQFATIVAGAKLEDLQLHVIHLNDKTLRVDSSPKSEALEAFLNTL
jgi:hypothetical protein